MKTPIHQSNSLHRYARASAAALLAGSLTLATGVAQSSTGGTSDTGSTTGAGSSTAPNTWNSDAGTAGTTTDTARDDSRMSDRSSRDANTATGVKRSEKKFLTKVAKSTPKEIAMAQLAVERASDPQVKSYAQQIIADHQQMSEQLVQLAQSKGVELENQAQLTSGGAGQGASHYGTGTASTGSGSGTRAGADTTGAGSHQSGSTGMTASTTATGASGSSTHALSEDITSDRHYRNLSKKSGAEFDKEFVSMMVEDHKKDLKLFQEQAEDAEDSAIRSFASQHAPVLQGHLDRAQTLSQSVAE